MKYTVSRVFIMLLMLLFVSNISAQVTYQKADSTKVMSLLKNAPKKNTSSEYMYYFGDKLQGIPYVAKTLEVNNKEQLIVNLRQLDCTTFVETVLTLTQCAMNGKNTFADYCRYLTLIRYEQGKVGYEYRLHYFSSWIADNTALGFVSEVTTNSYPFSKVQKMDINYMSTHVSQYPLLVANPSFIPIIRQAEEDLTGKECRYIPKSALKDYKTLKKYIHTGDIIAIVTSKAGLDTSHLGIASWHKDGTLHLLNASSIHKKVIDEPMTLYQYMQKHPSSIGIRVVRVN